MNPFETAEAKAILGEPLSTTATDKYAEGAPTSPQSTTTTTTITVAGEAEPTLPVSKHAAQEVHVDADKQMAAILSTRPPLPCTEHFSERRT